MHVAMTYPEDTALRGGNWAAAARCGGADVTEIVFVDRLSSPPLPTISWMTQTASRRYMIEIPQVRTRRRRARKLAERTGAAIDVIAGQHGAVDVLHTHGAVGSEFAVRLDSVVTLPRVHTGDAGDAASWQDAGIEHADLIRTWRGHSHGESLPEAFRDRLRGIPTPLDFSVDGATPLLARVPDPTPVEASGPPWLAALRPLRIVWRGDLISPEAEAMVDAFAELHFTGTRLEMIGDHLESSKLPDLGCRLGLDGRLIGRATGAPEEMADLISRADLLVVGSTQPLFEREAMTALMLGTPVVAPRTAVYDELVTRACGAVVDANDPAALVAAIRQTALGEVHDHHEMATHAARHALPAVGSLLADAYHELTTGKARPRPGIHVVDDERQIAS